MKNARHLLALLLLTAFTVSCDSEPTRTARRRPVGPAPAVPTPAPAPVVTEPAPAIAATPSPTRPAARTPRMVRPGRSTSLAPAPAWHPDTAARAAFYAGCTKALQAFTVPVEDDTVLTCAEGTRILVPADAFVDAQTGKPVEGAVQLQVREYLTTPDIVLNNLQTLSEGRLLETGGMLHLEATADGRPLALRRGAALTLALPRPGEDPKPGMRPFVGVRTAQGALDWRPLPLRDRRNVVRLRRPSYRGGWGRVSRAVRQQTAFSAEKARELGRHLPRAEKRRLRQLGKKLDYELVESVVAQFDVSRAGVLTNLQVLEGYDPACRDALETALLSLGTWRPAACWDEPRTYEGMQVRVLFTRKGNVLTRWERGGRADSACLDRGQYARQLERRWAANGGGPVVASSLDEVSSYVLSAASLGWINCDRFVDSPEPKVDLLVEAGGADVKVVFRNQRSVLNGEVDESGQRVRFSGLPAGTPITILALRPGGGITQIATRQTTVGTSSAVERDFTFRPITLEALKAEIARL